MRDDEYFAIKDRAAAQLLRIPHVTGVGIGGRERGGVPTGEVVIKVFVLRKLPATEVPPEQLIPAIVRGGADGRCRDGADDPTRRGCRTLPALRQ